MNNKHAKSLIHALTWSAISTIIFVGLALIFWTDSFITNFDKYWPFFLAVILCIFFFVLIYIYVIETKKEKKDSEQNSSENEENIFVNKNKKNDKK